MEGKSVQEVSDLLDSFVCPLTQEIMIDPCCDPEGNTYERSAIEEWLSRNQTSPITFRPLTIQQLTPHYEMKKIIDAMLAEEEAEHEPGSKSQDTNVVIAVPPPPVAMIDPELHVLAERYREQNAVLFTIKPPDLLQRTPLDLCCVIDISGSMNTNVSIQNAAHQVEQYHLTQLDVVKHALKMIIHSLGDQDHLTIVTFAAHAECLLSWSAMNVVGRTEALEKLETIQADGVTNLWGGIAFGLGSLKHTPRRVTSKPVHQRMFVLTDGVPNIDPPRGLLQELKDQIISNITMDVFGFGYDLDSVLLNEIACMGSGSFLFIPDASFVGTVFIHALTNALTTYAMDTLISLPRHTALITIAAIRTGQHRHHTINHITDDMVTLSAKIQYQPQVGVHSTQTHHIEFPCRDAVGENINWDTYSVTTCVAHVLRRLSTNAADHTLLNTLIANIESKCPQHPILLDLKGQVREAISREDWFQRWGRHYLLTLARAHELEVCTNFKDPGLQSYGTGTLFQQLRAEMNTIFCQLPAPVQAIDMSRFHDQNAGCIHGNCMVAISKSKHKTMKALQPGDYVLTAAGEMAQVLYTIRYKVQDQSIPMITMPGGLILTPWHPIRLHNTWQFPIHTGHSVTIQAAVDFVYNVILDQGHVLHVNGIECITLAHNFHNDPVAQHSYYGSQQVLNDIAKLCKQQGSRLVIVEQIQRDPTTNLVSHCM